MKLVTPKVYLLGATGIIGAELKRYLTDTNQEAFLSDIDNAHMAGVPDGEILCSFYAKLCYASLIPGRNDNITRTRSIKENVLATLASAHGSVFEHVMLNFVATDCSRVFTHELIRHRAGTAFSQTSGRYVRTDDLRVVKDPIIVAAGDELSEAFDDYLHIIENGYNNLVRLSGVDGMKDFGAKKRMTSALRRMLPNGMANEIGFSINLRALRHVIQLRTAAGAEWEIRDVFGQVFDLVGLRYPEIFADAKIREVDGLREIYGMRQQPYEGFADARQ